MSYGDYSITASYEEPDGDGERDREVVIFFSVNDWGYPASGPSYASGGEPGQGPELDYDRVEELDGAPCPALRDWAIDQLQGDYYETACEVAEGTRADRRADYQIQDRKDRRAGL